METTVKQFMTVLLCLLLWPTCALAGGMAADRYCHQYAEKTLDGHQAGPWIPHGKQDYISCWGNHGVTKVNTNRIYWRCEVNKKDGEWIVLKFEEVDR